MIGDAVQADGIYDDLNRGVRLGFKDGVARAFLDRDLIENEKREHVLRDPWYRPWGFYPDVERVMDYV